VTTNWTHILQKPINEFGANELIAVLNEGFQYFNNHYKEQFSLNIPKSTLSKIDDYRDYYFSYLDDSVFKSNMCYLLQFIDYQLWNYSIFKPKFSLENSFFYQLLITMGVISEALATTIILNPYIQSQKGDRSLGNVKVNHEKIKNFVIRNSFTANLELIKKNEVLPLNQITQFELIRKDIRNLVHIQNWSGRIYQSITYPFFRENLDQFKTFLHSVKKDFVFDKAISFDFLKVEKDKKPSTLWLLGNIISFSPSKGFGFIQDQQKQSYFFHKNDLAKITKKSLISKQVAFQSVTEEKGFRATNVNLLGEAVKKHD